MGNVSKKKIKIRLRFIIDLHVVDSQRSFLTDLRNTKYQKVIIFNVSVYWKFKKTENLRHRIIQFSIEVFKTTCLLINIRKCKKKKKRKWHYNLTF